MIGGEPSQHLYNITALPLVAGKNCSRSFPPSPRLMQYHASTLYRGEDLLVCGGLSDNDCYSLNIYNVVAVWQTVVSLPVAVYYHTMTTIGDTESVAVVGGWTSGRSLDILLSLL